MHGREANHCFLCLISLPKFAFASSRVTLLSLLLAPLALIVAPADRRIQGSYRPAVNSAAGHGGAPIAKRNAGRTISKASRLPADCGFTEFTISEAELRRREQDTAQCAAQIRSRTSLSCSRWKLVNTYPHKTSTSCFLAIHPRGVRVEWPHPLSLAPTK